VTLGVALAVFELVAAALTFAVAANVPAFRCSAVPAPIAAVILAPCLLLIAGPLLLRHMFIMQARRGAWAVYALAVALIIAACLAFAKAVTLACRAVFEFLPPWLDAKLGLRHELLLQAALVTGGGLSLSVVFLFFGWMAFVFRENPLWAVGFGLIGLAASTACVLALLQLPHPEPFQPVPVPAALKGIIFRHDLGENAL
jgi:hypothetical protein